MKRIYLARYKHGLKSPTKVMAENEHDAVNRAYAAYTYTAANGYPTLPAREIIESVVPTDDDIMSGTGIQPCVQTDCEPLTSDKALARIFRKNV